MRRGLRARLTVAFSLGALVLSGLLASVSYGLARENLVHQRETSAARQAYLNARVLRDSLPPQGGNEQVVLDALNSPTGASPVLFRDGQWFAANPVNRGREQLPVELRNLVISGHPARMRFHLDGAAYLAVGVPIPAIDGSYFEIASFDEVDSSLSSLGFALTVAAIVTTAAGAALGAAASRRVLSPLTPIGWAAEAIAGGRLDTRVARVDDPDIGTLVDSFNHMASALQTRVEQDARFASDISHELRSPLTTLAASAGVLVARRDELPERSQAALDLLVADVARFNAMVEDLLEISRFDAGAAHLHLETVRISELVLAAVGAATTEDVPVSVSAEAAASTVAVDKRRLVRVMANLLSNADRYGGGATLVAVELPPASDSARTHVRIAVEDAGTGVAPEDATRIFERFTRGADDAGRRGSGDGVGLGLALVQEHVRLHGGRVWVEDRPDGQPGARFVVELPLVNTGPLEAVEPADLGPAAVPASEVEG
jgi:signal transduction histidine kinase